MAANYRYDCLGDINRRGFNVSIECQCGHSAVLDARRMERWYRCHMWPTEFHRLREHLYCLACGGRPASVRVRPCDAEPSAPNRFPNTEAQWERLIRGLRG